MKKFNTTGICIPAKHYMVDITSRLEQIKIMVDEGEYFCINRARQYGKTTTLAALASYLQDDYHILSLDFQKISNAGFRNEEAFVKAFSRIVIKKKKRAGIPETIVDQLEEYIDRKEDKAAFDELFATLSEWCEVSDKPVVMFIDEVDSATNNQIFLDFLAQLRAGYLEKVEDPEVSFFQSVILAGVTDVKHIKSKIRDEDQHRVNSPLPTHAGGTSSGRFGRWNIAADFNIDMSLSCDGIIEMLREYEEDHHTGMDTGEIAGVIYDYTNGYPFLVSRICQLMDRDVIEQSGSRSPAEVWTRSGVDEAVKLLLSEKNTLFESLAGKLTNYPEMKTILHSSLMEGVRIAYNPLQDYISQMELYGFIRNQNNIAVITNRIFETFLYNLFLSDEELKSNVFGREGDLAKNIFVQDGKLNVRMILEHFIETYTQICGPLEERFKEKDGREQFLLYLKPIINGTGNYYIEAQTRDQKRTDVIIDYLGQQYIIEMKIWHGERYNAEGEKQIADYLDYFGLDVGYMLSFNFNKEKETGMKRSQIRNKLLFEAVL